MMRFSRTLRNKLLYLPRWLCYCAVLCASTLALGQERPASRPSDFAGAGQVDSRDAAKGSRTETGITDADKIARLQRSIDESTRQVEGLTAKINGPESEFSQAEAAFSAIDTQLTELKKSFDAAADEGNDAKKSEFQQKLSELQPKHKLAKDRFDLAISERKTVQEQVATLQQKIQQDTDALKKLKGDTPTPATTQPSGQEPTPARNSSLSGPAAGPAAPAPAPGPAPAGTTAALPNTQSPAQPAEPTAATTAAPNVQKPPLVKPTEELLKAREEATRKQEEAKSANKEVASITERIDALRKSIELEQKQFEITRKQAANAQETERTLYDQLQKKREDGASAEELRPLQSQITEARQRLRESENEIRDRTDRLNQYQSDLAALQTEHIAAMEEAKQRDTVAQRAKQRVESLESPLSPQNLWRWFLERGPRVGGIIIAMFGLLWLSRFGEHRIVKFMAGRGVQGNAEDRENRAKTLVGVVHSAASIVIMAGGGLMILTEMGVNIVPLMGGAAVLGLAVAFGAQNLIRDFFYGFMILLEGQYAINDVVKISDVAGQVERITLRLTVLRGLDGTVHFIPNGEITRVSNMTHEWSRAVFDIPVAYKENVDRVMQELIGLAKELRRDPAFRGLILELPEMLGVDEFADSAVVIKFLIKTRPLRQWIVKREMLRRIKLRFDELGIEIPFPHRTVYHRTDDLSLAAEKLPGVGTEGIHHDAR